MNEITLQRYGTPSEDYTYYGAKVTHFIPQGAKIQWLRARKTVGGWVQWKKKKKKRKKEKKIKKENSTARS